MNRARLEVHASDSRVEPLPTPPVFDFIRAQLPDPPVRVLEVGCGAGELALALDAAGYEVTAIDPAAPTGPIFRPLKVEDLDESERFDAVVANRSLHHVRDLDVALDRIVAVLEPGGVLVLDEFAWDRLDLRTADWLHRQRQVLATSGGAADVPETLDRCLEDWEHEHLGLHGYEAMHAALAARFDERLFVWMPYLYRLLEGLVTEELERGLIERGEIAATGFRYVGVLRD
jgi:SAM-dependent methyltransferase